MLLLSRRQLGFGWGKGRRVIKTIIQGGDVARALEKHQQWVDAHPDERPDVDLLQPIADVKAERFLRTHKRALAYERELLQRENATLRRRARMAKADLHAGER